MAFRNTFCYVFFTLIPCIRPIPILTRYFPRSPRSRHPSLSYVANASSFVFSSSSDKRQSVRLVYIPGQCRAVEIKEIIKHRLEEFDLYFEQDVVAVTSDGPNVMVKFGRENPTEMVLCLNHAVHLAVLETFCKKNETNENFTSNQDSDNLSGEESEYDEDNCDLEPEIRTNYTQNIDKALQDTRALVKLF
ncbi:hypothetical protein EVAR_20682_1 [Eumeta japonica]|uniref:Uncharacterized protein n=1 Tax=Eumeta variegata TaxID=151549 RepID=A0A4C1V9F1_EUMVA|nr:hypothetical protein EVAR_20682_1 [Eumeta japonica]